MKLSSIKRFTLLILLLVAVYYLFTITLGKKGSFVNPHNPKFNSFKTITVEKTRELLDSATGLSKEQKRLLSKYRNDIIDILVVNQLTKGGYLRSAGSIDKEKAIENMGRLYGSGFHKTRSLAFTDIKINRIPHEALGFFEDLTTLHMGSCNITGRFDCLNTLPKLTYLFLTGNKITEIPDLSKFKALTHLYLDQNRNLTLNPDSFDVGSLEILHVMYTGVSLDDVRKLRKRYPGVLFRLKES